MISHSYSFLSSNTRTELDKVEKFLFKEMSKGNNYISSEALRLLKGGGKRIRPLLTILFSMLGEEYNSRRTILAAAALETLHMATLVHDDTIDNSDQRRGIDTTFKKHGIHTAVYTGDWMFVKSLQILAMADNDSYVNSKMLQMLAGAMESICSGEINQYYGRGIIPSRAEYFSRIKDKTAALFAAACVFGAKNSDLPENECRLAMDFGYSFGTAFQIQDDILDIKTSSKTAGKPVSNDINEGIITLPILLACEKSEEFKSMVTSFLSNPGRKDINLIYDKAESLGGTVLSISEARKHLNKCMRIIEKSGSKPASDEILLLLKNIFVYL